MVQAERQGTAIRRVRLLTRRFLLLAGGKAIRRNCSASSQISTGADMPASVGMTSWSAIFGPEKLKTSMRAALWA